MNDLPSSQPSVLTPIDEALSFLLASIAPCCEAEVVALFCASGRILSHSITAPLSVPPMANSAMDGYALRAADSVDPERDLAVSQRIAAGQVGVSLEPGTAARIFTGAPLPAGADAVVMQENCERRGEGIRVNKAVAPNENVRPIGADIKAGSTVFAQGRRLRPQDIGALASLGLTEVSVTRKLRVALMTTGDELQRPGSDLLPGQIYDSNFATLTALLTGLHVDIVDCGRVGDTLAETRDALLDAAGRADCVITTGGVSVGEEDHVRAAIEQLGTIDLWKLAVKPGKPFAFGKITSEGESCQFFGLPGNPVSAFVTFALVVRPALLALQGATPASPHSFSVRSGFSRDKGGPRQEYLRAVLEQAPEGLVATPLRNQSSGVALSLSRSDGLLIVPPSVGVTQGEILQFIPFSELGA
ncbi:molybdopterin molybdotransferase MoeA [Gammaproteobacteria bacterium]|jgi:molybdopterin molybdotransferase|nr:molybdopterin molybdotransferase MoeA [Gammaproteobacteria bacterium]MDC1510937.1 molybdopterin molybdotransferase MoeA [Gammaproteobacteria bacterium]